MKLLHIIATMNPESGGPCQGIRNSNPEIRRFGVTREVVSLDDPAADFLGKDDFLIHPMGPAKGPWQYSARLKPWLEANLSRFDAVVINGLWIYPSYAGWAALKVLNKKAKSSKTPIDIPRVFVMPHGMLDPYFQRAPERKIKAVRNWIYWKLIENKVVNDLNGVLFTCQTELLLARESFSPYHPKKELNVGYGIMPPPAYTELMSEAFLNKCPPVKGKPYLLFLSRIHKKKGVDMLVKAYAQIVEATTAENKPVPLLVIAGPGINAPFGESITQLISSYPQLKDRLFLPGMLTGDAKWGALYGSEAFVLPSHQENFGIAVVEALACKKPVLISKQVNIWKEIEEGGGGIIEADTEQGTLTMLQKWLKTPQDQQEQMAGRAFKVFSDNFHTGPASAAFIKAIS